MLLRDSIRLACSAAIFFSIWSSASKWPNDPKLSDGGAWRGSCEGGAQKGATDVGQSHERMRRVQARIAATVTRGAVRHSAWLGVAVESGIDDARQREYGANAMEAIAEQLENKLHEWKPETSQKVRVLVAEIIELADDDALDIGRSRSAEQEVMDILDEPSPR